jgi:hypothetical protein
MSFLLDASDDRLQESQTQLSGIRRVLKREELGQRAKPPTPITGKPAKLLLDFQTRSIFPSLLLDKEYGV